MQEISHQKKMEADFFQMLERKSINPEFKSIKEKSRHYQIERKWRDFYPARKNVYRKFSKQEQKIIGEGTLKY